MNLCLFCVCFTAAAHLVGTCDWLWSLTSQGIADVSVWGRRKVVSQHLSVMTQDERSWCGFGRKHLTGQQGLLVLLVSGGGIRLNLPAEVKWMGKAAWSTRGLRQEGTVWSLLDGNRKVLENQSNTATPSQGCCPLTLPGGQRGQAHPEWKFCGEHVHTEATPFLLNPWETPGRGLSLNEAEQTGLRRTGLPENLPQGSVTGEC